MTTHTVPIEDHMRVKHDAKALVVIKSGNRVLDKHLANAETLGGEMTTLSFMYNRASMSGGVDWWNPATGESLPSVPKIMFWFRPEDVLTGDEECNCERCNT